MIVIIISVIETKCQEDETSLGSLGESEKASRRRWLRKNPALKKSESFQNANRSMPDNAGKQRNTRSIFSQIAYCLSTEVL